MKIMAGNSNLPLARAIAGYLELPLTDASVRRFADEEVFVEIHSKRMPDGTIQSIYHDISQRKQAEEALRLSEAKYRNLHETMRDAFVAADLQGRIQDFNPAFRKLTGYSAAELRNMSYRRLTPRK